MLYYSLKAILRGIFTLDCIRTIMSSDIKVYFILRVPKSTAWKCHGNNSNCLQVVLKMSSISGISQMEHFRSRRKTFASYLVQDFKRKDGLKVLVAISAQPNKRSPFLFGGLSFSEFIKLIGSEPSSVISITASCRTFISCETEM